MTKSSSSLGIFYTFIYQYFFPVLNSILPKLITNYFQRDIQDAILLILIILQVFTIRQELEEGEEHQE